MQIIDLTHTLSEDTTPYPGKTPFHRVACANYENGYKAEDMTLSLGIGTHMDAPSHFCRDGISIDAIPLEQCNGPICVLHLSEKIGDMADYAISTEDILEWESANGQIPPRSLLFIHTGWDRHWETALYCNQDQKGTLHFPGLSEEAAELLAVRRVSAVGLDTMSIDVGTAPVFKAHLVLLPKGIVLIENLANLGQLPPTGATGWVCPMKIKDAPEAPIRAIALLN